jgi:hypothetical protein
VRFLWAKKYGSKGYPQINAAHMGIRTTPRCSIVVHVFRGAAIL